MTVQQIQLRRGTATDWSTANPTLAAGEPGVELDTGLAKIGDGTTSWTALARGRVAELIITSYAAGSATSRQ